MNMAELLWYIYDAVYSRKAATVEGWLRDLGAKEWQVNDANPNGISVLVTKPK